MEDSSFHLSETPEESITQIVARAVAESAGQQPPPPQPPNPPVDLPPPADPLVPPEERTATIPNIPYGVAERLVGPTEDTEIPFVKTYTSTRNLVGEISSMHLHAEKMDVKFTKTLLKHLDVDVAVDNSEWKNCTIDAAFKNINEIEVDWRVRANAVDLSGLIYGQIKGIPRTARAVGRLLVRDTTTILEVCSSGDWGRCKLRPCQAYTPALIYLTDENALKAQRSLHSVFMDVPTGHRDVAIVCNAAAGLNLRGVNPTRFVARLAIMYVTALFSTLGTNQPCILRATEDVCAVNMREYNSWATEVITNHTFRNYVPWSTRNSTRHDQDDHFYAILSFACRTEITIGIEGNRSPPLCWPRIDNVTLLGIWTANQNLPRLYEVQADLIHQVALAWCNRYASTEMFQQLVEVFSILYWNTSGFNLVCPGLKNSICMPTADMAGYCLAPLLEDTSMKAPLTLGHFETKPRHMAFQSAQLALLLNFVRQYQQYMVVDAALEYSIFTTPDKIELHCKPLTRIAAAMTTPIWDCVQRCWRDFGLAGELGTIIRSISLEDDLSNYVDFVTRIQTHRISSFDVIPWLRTLPEDLAVARWMAPLPFDFFSQQNLHYTLEHFKTQGPMKVMRCVGELSDVQGYITFAGRNTHEVRSHKSTFVRLDSRGLPRDFSNVNFTLDDGSQLRTGFRITSHISQLTASDPKHDRYNLEWFFISRVLTHNLVIKKMDGVFPDPPLPILRIEEVTRTNQQNIERLRRQGRATLRRILDRQGAPRDPPSRGPTPPRGPGGDDDSNTDSPRPPPPGSGPNRDYFAPGNQGNDRMMGSLDAWGQTVDPDHTLRQAKEAMDLAREQLLTREKEEWKNQDLQTAALLLGPEIKLYARTLDKTLNGNLSLAWAKNLIEVAASYTGFLRGVGEEPAVTLSGLGVDQKIVRTWNVGIVLELLPENRGAYLGAAIGVLIFVIGGSFTQENSRRLSSLIAGLKVLAQHMTINPTLDATVYIKTSGMPAHAELATKLLSHADPSRAILNLMVEQHNTRIDLDEMGNLESEDILAKLLNILDKLKAWDGQLEMDVGTIVTIEFKDEILKLSPGDRCKLAEAIKQTTDARAALIENKRTCREQLQGFQKRDDEDEDDDAPSTFGPRRSQRKPRPEGSKTSKRQPSGKKRGGDTKPRKPNTDADDEIKWCRLCWTKQQRAMVYLQRGCVCSLLRKFGGKWGLDDACIPDNHTFQNFKSWFASLDTQQKARYMVYEQYAVAGMEHFQTLFDANFPMEVSSFSCAEYYRRRDWFTQRMANLDPSQFDRYKILIKGIQKYYWNFTKYKSDFKKASLKGGIPIFLNCSILINIFPNSKPLIELLHNKSPGSEEYEVCTFAFSFLSLPLEVATELICLQWFDTPLEEWHKTYKNHVVRAKRSNILGTLKGSSVLTIRKILNTTIRREGDCDITLEMENRCSSATPKTLLSWSANDYIQKGSGQAEYIRRFWDKSCALWKPVVDRLREMDTTSTAREFWERRALTTANGASTLIKLFDRKKIDQKIGQEDRVGKKMVMELLGDDFLDVAMQTHPTNRATYFVKPEPGKKLRALYSSYDEETFIASYASFGQENHMWVIPGVMVRQTPHDVGRWMAESENELGSTFTKEQFWMSTDYSDYNAEHTLLEMGLVDAALAYTWARYSNQGTDPAIVDKVLASSWVATSYGTSYINWGVRATDGFSICKDGNDGYRLFSGNMFTDLFKTHAEADAAMGTKMNCYSRVVNGLYSGSRDTARNNTFIHAVDVAIVFEELESLDIHPVRSFVALCGDDEDIKFATPADAIVYYNMLSPCGHALNPAKQMSGAEHHEFLQLVWNKGYRVEKPMCALLSTLGTGNWYIQLGVWVQSVIEACIANWWEAYCRGVPLAVAQRACCCYLDRLMFISRKLCAGTEWEASGKRLEWWQYRMQDNFMPLFQNTPGPTKRIPKYEATPSVEPTWPRAASSTYCKNQRYLLKWLPPKNTNEFQESLLLDTIGSSLKSWRQQETKRWAASHWPERTNAPDIRMFTVMRICTEQPRSLGILFIQTPRQKGIISEAAVYARMGISMYIGRKLGGLRNLWKFLPLRQLAKMAEVQESSFAGNLRFYELQVNLRACLSYWKTPHPEYHGHKELTYHDELTYVFMGNGAGKTHFKNVFGGVDDLDELWTDLYGSFREKFGLSIPKSSFNRLCHIVKHILDESRRSHGVLLGQLEPASIMNATKDLGFPVKCYYYDPGEEIRFKRLQNRAWSSDKIEARMTRAREFYAQAIAAGWEQMKTVDDLNALVESAQQQKQRKMGITNYEYPKQKMTYVFDKTELVTRKLEIEEMQKEPSALIDSHEPPAYLYDTTMLEPEPIEGPTSTTGTVDFIATEYLKNELAPPKNRKTAPPQEPTKTTDQKVSANIRKRKMENTSNLIENLRYYKERREALMQIVSLKTQSYWTTHTNEDRSDLVLRNDATDKESIELDSGFNTNVPKPERPD